MSPNWSRRTFVSNLALSAAVPMRVFGLGQGGAKPYLAFMGRAFPSQPHLDRVEMFRVEGGCWSPLHCSVTALNPRALAMHPRMPVLYVAHATAEHGNLPRGSVSAFALDVHAGSLSLLSHQPLALSATHPNRLTLSPDGRQLIVAASTGGAWNIFHLDSDGVIQPVPSAIKLTGTGPHALQRASWPHTAVFHPGAPYAYATDFGSDHIDTIALAEPSPVFASRLRVAPGSGPAHLVLHPSGSLLVAVSNLRPALTVFRIGNNGDVVPEPVDHCVADAEVTGPLACNRSGDVLYFIRQDRSGDAVLSVFALSASTGRLRELQRIALAGKPLPAQLIALDDELLLLSEEGVDTVSLDRHSGYCIEGATSDRALDAAHAVSLATLSL